jgi:Protein of unknown function (DUF4230)
MSIRTGRGRGSGTGDRATDFDIRRMTGAFEPVIPADGTPAHPGGGVYRAPPEPPPPSPPPPPPPRRRGRILTALVGFTVVIVVLALIAGALVRFADWRPSLSDPFGTRSIDRSQPVLLKSVQNLSTYKAATGNFQLIIDMERDARFIPSIIKGERTLFVAAGSVDAEVDFSRIGSGAIEVSDDGHTARVTLPHPALGKVRIDPDNSYVASTQRGILDRIGSALSSNPNGQRELYQLADKRIQAAAVSSGLVERAEQNTRVMLESMLRSLGYTNVTVTFSGPVPPR